MYPSFVPNGKKPFAKSWWQRLSLKRPATFKQRRHAAPPILIYQFGKVGSSSLLDSLTPQWPGLVIHTHSLKEYENEPEQMTVAREILQRSNERMFIISTVRDPIGRNISAFFQNFERETGVSDKQAHNISVHRLIELFLEKFPHDTPLNWFNDHFKNSTGIDIFDYGFSSLGVQTIRRGNVDLLLMLSELPDWLKETAVKQFLGLDQFRLMTTNVGSNKRYAETYRKFLQTFIAPDWYVQKMYGSRFFRHFYTPHQEALTALWTRQLTSAETATQLKVVEQPESNVSCPGVRPRRALLAG